jgi:hypothetical protein
MAKMIIMGLLGPYVYKTKGGKKFWLHMKKRGKATLFYFSKDPVGALFNIPKGYEIVDDPKMSLPMLKKGAGGLFSGFLKKSPKKEEPVPEVKQ